MGDSGDDLACLPSEALDKERLARRAEILQRLADQLVCQLEVERRSNDELRSLAGDEAGTRRASDEERAATNRFMTFAAVAVVTAAAVAMLVARPWRSTEVHLSHPPDLRLSAPMELGPARGRILPFTVIDVPRPGVRGSSGPKLRTSQSWAFDCDPKPIVIDEADFGIWELTRVP